MGEIVVREHAGRSGKSVFRWRVFHECETGVGGGKKHRFQLAKYRTKEAADRAADHFRKNAERVSQMWGERCPQN